MPVSLNCGPWILTNIGEEKPNSSLSTWHSPRDLFSRYLLGLRTARPWWTHPKGAGVRLHEAEWVAPIPVRERVRRLPSKRLYSPKLRNSGRMGKGVAVTVWPGCQWLENTQLGIPKFFSETTAAEQQRWEACTEGYTVEIQLEKLRETQLGKIREKTEGRQKAQIETDRRHIRGI